MSQNTISLISRSHLTADTSLDVHKKDFAAVTSYTWLSSSAPTILVPSAPPTWTPRPVGTKLYPDSGRVIINSNAFHNPGFPLEPLFLAALAVDPDFSLENVDLVTDRNNLRKLLSFVAGDSDNEFKIQVQQVENTTVLQRCEANSSEIITGFRGYGHNFETAYTKWPKDAEGARSHHRVVKYEFGGVRCLVRFEVDAVLADADEEDDNQLISGLQGLALNRPSADKPLQSGLSSRRMTLKSGGVLVSQRSIAEIKTRASHRPLNMVDTLPQLWFSDTGNLLVAYHSRGMFNDVQRQEMRTSKLPAWEKDNAENLRKLAKLLLIIIEKAKSGCCEIVYRGGDRLEFVKKVGGRSTLLPAELLEKLHKG